MPRSLGVEPEQSSNAPYHLLEDGRTTQLPPCSSRLYACDICVYADVSISLSLTGIIPERVRLFSPSIPPSPTASFYPYLSSPSVVIGVPAYASRSPRHIHILVVDSESPLRDSLLGGYI